MRKIILWIVCLCLIGTVAFAEDVIELNWAEIGTEEVQTQGEFYQVETPDKAAVTFWLPSFLNAVDLSGMEGFFVPQAVYASEDMAYSVAIFTFEVASLDEHAATMKSDGGGSDFRHLTINGVGCIGYEVKAENMESLIYPVSDHMVVSFNITPMDGDEDWDAVKAAILASIQPVQ